MNRVLSVTAPFGALFIEGLALAERVPFVPNPKSVLVSECFQVNVCRLLLSIAFGRMFLMQLPVLVTVINFISSHLNVCHIFSEIHYGKMSFLLFTLIS